MVDPFTIRTGGATTIQPQQWCETLSVELLNILQVEFIGCFILSLKLVFVYMQCALLHHSCLTIVPAWISLAYITPSIVSVRTLTTLSGL